MAIIYSTATKDTRLTATRDACASGTLEIGTTGFATILSTHAITAVGGSVTSGAWTLAFDATGVTATGTGTGLEARIKDSVAADRITGLTVGTGGTDIVLDNNVITTGQTVTLTSAVITHG